MNDPRLAIAAQRLRNQLLVGPPADSAEQVVRHLGGMQAQEYPVARWSIGARSSDLHEAGVDRALTERRIVRTHVLRDTWHLVAADDLRWMVELTRPRIQARNETMHRKLDLDSKVLDRTDALIVEALSAGRKTRRQLSAYLAEHGEEAEGPRLAYIIMHGELELLICSGGLDGKQHTYALVDERVPRTPSMSRDEALVKLARRYFRSHGPATVKDFAWWASLTMRDARQSVEPLGDELEHLELDGRTYLSGAAPADEAPLGGAPRAHLLQSYDEYVIAYSESRDVLDFGRLAGPTPTGRSFTHTVVLDGQVIGHWRRRPHPRMLEIDMQLARTLTGSQKRSLDDAVQRYAAFLELPAGSST